MENLTLAALAQHFAHGGPHFMVAGSISEIPRPEADEYCPFFLGTEGHIGSKADFEAEWHTHHYHFMNFGEFSPAPRLGSASHPRAGKA